MGDHRGIEDLEVVMGVEEKLGVRCFCGQGGVSDLRVV